MSSSLVRRYYTETVRDEWRRTVADPYHRLEYETTIRYLEQYLPKRGLILDAGGGPGRYTVELARRGYDVVLLDFTPANLRFARQQVRKAGLERKVWGFVKGTLVDLSAFADSTFDAVLCLGGPLSHIVNRRRRAKAVRELIRVAKKRAPLFVSVMGRMAVLITQLRLYQHELELPFTKRLRDTGDYRGGHGFTACHFFLPEEFRHAFENKGVKILTMAGLEGLSSHHPRLINALARNRKRWQNWLETHERTRTHPSVVGMSEHMLVVARKL